MPGTRPQAHQIARRKSSRPGWSPPLRCFWSRRSSSANFVYWASSGQTTIGRAKLNGSGVNNAFIQGLTGVQAVAVDSQHIYWTQGLGTASSIGRANLDGSGANANFIPHAAGVQDFDPPSASSAAGIAVNSTAIFWENSGSGQVGKANLDGSSPTGALVVSGPEPSCGLVADQNFVYWLDTGLAQSIGRATVNGTDRQRELRHRRRELRGLRPSRRSELPLFRSQAARPSAAPRSAGAPQPRPSSRVRFPPPTRSAASRSTPNTSSGATPVQVTSSAARIWAVAPRIRA